MCSVNFTEKQYDYRGLSCLSRLVIPAQQESRCWAGKGAGHAYNRAKHLNERAKMVQAWTDFLGKFK